MYMCIIHESNGNTLQKYRVYYKEPKTPDAGNSLESQQSRIVLCRKNVILHLIDGTEARHGRASMRDHP